MRTPHRIQLLGAVAAIALVMLFVMAPSVVAHEGEQHVTTEEALMHAEENGMETTLEQVLRARTIDVLVWGSLMLVVLVALAVMWKEGRGIIDESAKKILFGGIVLVTVVVTVFVAGSTIYLNVVSETGGPVHWHADFRIIHCGDDIDLVDPSGFSNKVGTSVFHEHGDLRIHVEGVVVEEEEASLRSFFAVVGGEFAEGRMTVPTNDGIVRMQNGDQCPNGETGVLQTFVWETTEENETMVARQRKLTDAPSYVLSPEPIVPPGDCLIVLFGPEQETVDHVCEQYEVAEQRGDLIIER